MPKDILRMSRDLKDTNNLRIDIEELLKNPNSNKRFRSPGTHSIFDVLVYSLLNGLLEKGYIEELETKNVAEECEVADRTVRRFNTIFGFAYEKDGKTKKADQSESLGYIEKYVKETRADNKINNKHKRKVVYSIAVTKKFYERLDELNFTGYTRLSDEELEALHSRLLNDSFTEIEVIRPVDGFVIETTKRNNEGEIVSYKKEVIEEETVSCQGRKFGDRFSKNRESIPYSGSDFNVDSEEDLYIDFTEDDQIEESLVNEVTAGGLNEETVESDRYSISDRFALMSNSLDSKFSGNVDSIKLMYEKQESNLNDWEY